MTSIDGLRGANKHYDFVQNDRGARSGHISESLSVVFKASGRKDTPSHEAKVNEEELYAANLHSFLRSKNSALAEKFMERLPDAIKKSIEVHGSARVFNAADRVMRRLLREGELTHTEYKMSRDHAFGRSQLDGDRSFLSRSEGIVIAEASKKVGSNSSATPQEIGEYKRELHKIKGLNNSAPSGSANTNIVAHTSSSAPAGFLWKPSSDNDGNLVVLLPSNLAGKAIGVKILSPNGQILSEGRYAGIANGFRQHFRFDRPGGSFPNGSIVEIQISGGAAQRIKIGNTASRVE